MPIDGLPDLWPFNGGHDEEIDPLLLEVERREFLRKAARWGGGVLLGAGLAGLAASCAKAPTTSRLPSSAAAQSAAAPPQAAPLGSSDLAIASGQVPGELARKAVNALGGMGRFVKAGNTVVIKPNASFTDPPGSGTSTNPEVVAAVVSMCKEAGAARVIVLDHTLRGDASVCLARNGIGGAVAAAGGEMIAYGASDHGHGVDATIPGATTLPQITVFPEVLSADVVITVPVAKNHEGAGLSLGMKNFIGVTTSMSKVHQNDLHQSIADLNSLVKPKLSVIDATVMLMSNGPGGPGPTTSPGQVIASGDVVAADSYACTLFGMTANDVPYVVDGGKLGLGQVDFTRLKTARV